MSDNTIKLRTFANRLLIVGQHLADARRFLSMAIVEAPNDWQPNHDLQQITLRMCEIETEIKGEQRAIDRRTGVFRRDPDATG